LFAEWHLKGEKVATLAAGENFAETESVAAEIAVNPDWSSLLAADPKAAIAEQKRLKEEFEAAFAAGLIGRGFARDDEKPRYLLYRK
jgi:hypothetical protein